MLSCFGNAETFQTLSPRLRLEVCQLHLFLTDTAEWKNNLYSACVQIFEPTQSASTNNADNLLCRK